MVKRLLRKWSRNFMVFLAGILCGSFVTTVLFASVLPKPESARSKHDVVKPAQPPPTPSSDGSRTSRNDWGPHRIAILVPFKDRFEELLQFAPHMNNFLNRQHVAHDIIVINQVDKHRFNRAALLNVGFLYSKNQSRCDYLAMHDVDLLPANDALKYMYPGAGPLHIAAPDLHPLYHYKTFVGGILLLTNQHFDKVNGLSNRFWGWGREDDEFYRRMIDADLKIHRPQNIKTGYKTFRHLHDRDVRKRDMKRYGEQKELSRRRDRVTGVSSVQYRVDSVHNVTISHAPVTILNVLLHCDYNLTPWCDEPQPK